MSSRKRIVHLISSLESGGCENMLLRTLPALHDDEFEQVVITLFRPGQLAATLRRRGVRHIDLGGLGRLVPLLRELKPSLIITYLFHADMIGRLFVQPQIRVPVITFLRTTYNFSRYLPARIAERLTKGFVRHYLANSEAVKQYYVEQIGVLPERVTVIPNGIDLTVFDAAIGSAVTRELQLPKGRVVIACVANLAKNKGHSFLLEAFEGLVATHDNLWLLLVGAGEEEQVLKQQLATYTSKDRILFLGRRTDVPAVLAASDIFVLPTLFEGMSNAIQEAMAARIPVITTEIPENRILISHQTNGILVPTKSTSALQRSIGTLVANGAVRKQLGRAARITIEQEYSMAIITDAWRTMLHRWSLA